MSYRRVLPRDLFNEGKLLKCMGRLTLLIENGFLPLTLEYDGKAFDIRQDQSDGMLFVENIKIYTPAGQRLAIHTALNGRSAYPCYAILDDDEMLVFDEMGSPTIEFRELINRPKS